MSKVVALCCILFPAICHASCAPGTDTCDVMDEAALVQRDMSLAQKSLQQATDINRTTAAKHISEALSLQYISKATLAKLEMAKQFAEDVDKDGKEMLRATKEYKERELHSEDEFSALYDAVLSRTAAAVQRVQSATRAAEEEKAETKEALVTSLDFMEGQATFADLVTKFVVTDQKSGQASFLSKTVTEGTEKMVEGFDPYYAKTYTEKNGFKEEEFKKVEDILKMALATVQSSLQGFVTINEQKLKKVDEARLKYTSHSEASLNDAISQLVATDKGGSRAALAKQLNGDFPRREHDITTEMTKFSKTEKGSVDFKTFRKSMEKAYDTILLRIDVLHDMDVRDEKVHRHSLVASLNNLADEEDFATKLMKFATALGREKLGADLRGPVSQEVAKVKDALDKYEADGYTAKAFGPMYGQFVQSLITTKNLHTQWDAISAMKVDEMKPADVKLQAFMLK